MVSIFFYGGIMKEKFTRPDWGKLFESVLTEPGRLGECYNLFHRYSLGNQVLAMEQMIYRGIQIGPISSFNGWKKVGRKVKKGEKAIALLMPVVKKEAKDDGTEEEAARKFFIMKNHWFALAQTEPVDPENPGTVSAPETPEWNKAMALENLSIREVAFEEINGNCQGFAMPNKGEIAINPLAAMPWKVTFHELAHCLLHSKEAEVAFVDSSGNISMSIEEAEAESVAFLCCATLGLPGLEEARGYVQKWLGSAAFADGFAKKSAARVFSAADKILKAGSVKTIEASQEGEVEHA
jgi:antirestriction protein ArdC